MSAVIRVLDRVRRVKVLRTGSWCAACPCCDSRRGRPLSIREADGGRVLLHPFCGCQTGDVLVAIGLKLSDLFDTPSAHYMSPIRGGFSAREVLMLIAHEATVAAMLAAKFADGSATMDDHDRLALAATRLGKAEGLIHAH